MSAQKKQTAVEYAIDRLHKMGIIEHIDDALVEQIRNEALAMEREQIEEAYLAYRHNRTSKDAEDYYTETYGK